MKTLEQLEQIPSNGIVTRQEGAVLRLFFDIRKADAKIPGDGGKDTEPQPEGLCECYNVDVNAPFTYGNIVAAIVNDRYSADDTQALIANLTDARDAESALSEGKRSEYIGEWNAFQTWRAKAKDIAAEVMETVKI